MFLNNILMFIYSIVAYRLSDTLIYYIIDEIHFTQQKNKDIKFYMEKKIILTNM